MIIHLTKKSRCYKQQENYTIKKIFSVTGPWPTFCCLAHSDVNFHFKNFNTSNTSLTLGEPHKLEHTLSTLSSKYDSVCHRKTCMAQKMITENPGREFQVFREFQWMTMAFLDCFTFINEKSGICIAHPL